MKTDVYFAQKGPYRLIAYENSKAQNVFLQIDRYNTAPKIINTTICDKSQHSIDDVLKNYLEYELIKRENIEIGVKYKHIWKPLMNVKIQDELNFSTIDLCRAKRDLAILIQKLQEILLYIEPSEEGLKAYSHKIKELLILACTEVENSFKYYNLGNNQKTSDYIKILKVVDLTKYKISLVGYANPYKCCPFKNWNDAEPTKSLPWYDAYNNIKHNSSKNFNLATFENCLNAIAAKLILFAIRYSPMSLYNEFDTCAQLTRSSLDYNIEDSEDIYIPLIEGARSYSGAFTVPFKCHNGKVIQNIYDIAQTIPYEEREVK